MILITKLLPVKHFMWQPTRAAACRRKRELLAQGTDQSTCLSQVSAAANGKNRKFTS